MVCNELFGAWCVAAAHDAAMTDGNRIYSRDDTGGTRIRLSWVKISIWRVEGDKTRRIANTTGVLHTIIICQMRVKYASFKHSKCNLCGYSDTLHPRVKPIKHTSETIIMMHCGDKHFNYAIIVFLLMSYIWTHHHSVTNPDTNAARYMQFNNFRMDLPLQKSIISNIWLLKTL